MRQNIDEIAGVLNLNTLNSESCTAARITNRWASNCHLHAKDSLPLIHARPGLLYSVQLAPSTCPALLLGSCMIFCVYRYRHRNVQVGIPLFGCPRG
jgi:hypothetical protein